MAFKSLGLQFKTHAGPSRVAHGDALENFTNAIQRVSILPLGREKRLHFVKTSANKKLDYVIMGTFPPFGLLKEARKKVPRILDSFRHTMRTQEIALAVHNNPCQIDIVFVSVHKILLDLHKL